MTLDARADLVLQALRQGPANTVQLQRSPIVHVAKQIHDLRREGYFITTKRLPNGVALYTLEPDPPVGAGPIPHLAVSPADAGGEVRGTHNPAPTRAPVFGDVALIRAGRPKRRR